MKSLICSALTAAALLVPAMSDAAPISFTFTATGASLILDGVSKTGIDFTVHFVADTNNVGYAFGDPNVPIYDGLTGAMHFSDGVNLTFNGAYVFNNRPVTIAGFGSGGDLFDLSDPSLSGYDGLSSFGPIGSTSIIALSQWTNLATSMGSLAVSSVRSGTFSAQLDDNNVPEPGSLPLLGLGMLGVWLGRRNRSLQ